METKNPNVGTETNNQTVEEVAREVEATLDAAIVEDTGAEKMKRAKKAEENKEEALYILIFLNRGKYHPSQL